MQDSPPPRVPTDRVVGEGTEVKGRSEGRLLAGVTNCMPEKIVTEFPYCVFVWIDIIVFDSGLGTEER